MTHSHNASWVKKAERAKTVPGNPADTIQPTAARTSLPFGIMPQPPNKQEVNLFWTTLKADTKVYIGMIDTKDMHIPERVLTRSVAASPLLNS
jgi:hypothetical protein